MPIQLKYVTKTGITPDEFLNDIVTLMTNDSAGLSDLVGADQGQSEVLGNYGEATNWTLYNSDNESDTIYRRVLTCPTITDPNTNNFLVIKTDDNGQTILIPCEDFDDTDGTITNPAYNSTSFVNNIGDPLGDGVTYYINTGKGKISIQQILIGQQISGIPEYDETVKNDLFWWNYIFNLTASTNNGAHISYIKLLNYDKTIKTSSYATLRIMGPFGTMYTKMSDIFNNDMRTHTIFDKIYIFDMNMSKSFLTYSFFPIRSVGQGSNIYFSSVSGTSIGDIVDVDGAKYYCYYKGLGGTAYSSAYMRIL